MVKNGDNTKGKQMDLGTEPLLEEFFTVKQLSSFKIDIDSTLYKTI